MPRRFFLCAAAAAVVCLPACGGDSGRTLFDRTSGLSFRYPHGWSTTGFSQRTSPQRLVVASYRVSARDVEGDCGGSAALRRLPQDGAAVPLIDYGTSEGFRPHPAVFKLSQFQHGGYECFGDGYMLLFRRAGRD